MKEEIEAIVREFDDTSPSRRLTLPEASEHKRWLRSKLTDLASAAEKAAMLRQRHYDETLIKAAEARGAEAEQQIALKWQHKASASGYKDGAADMLAKCIAAVKEKDVWGVEIVAALQALSDNKGIPTSD